VPFYPGTGLAVLINTNSQVFLFNAERIGAGTPSKASVAFQLERQKSAAYPFGFAVEIAFSGAPGTFEIDVQGAETDKDANYCTIGSTVTAVNSSNVCRFEGVSLYPKYVRIFVKTLGNDVTLTAVLTR
jgi:hypothetical protein